VEQNEPVTQMDLDHYLDGIVAFEENWQDQKDESSI
jgi:hypothetical protein